MYADLTPGPANGAKVSPIQSEANGEAFAQVYGEFAGALAARKIASTDPRFAFASSVLLDGQTTVAVPGGGGDLRFNGPRSPEDLSAASPGTAARIKLTPGTFVNIKLITGATLFPNVAPPGARRSFRAAAVAVAAGLGENGLMVQGAYHDTGACFGPAPNCT